MTTTNEAVKRVEEFFDGFIPHEKIHNHGPLPHNRSSLDVDDVRTLLAALEARDAEIERLCGAIQKAIDAMHVDCETGFLCLSDFDFGELKKALKGGV